MCTLGLQGSNKLPGPSKGKAHTAANAGLELPGASCPPASGCKWLELQAHLTKPGC